MPTSSEKKKETENIGEDGEIIINTMSKHVFADGYSIPKKVAFNQSSYLARLKCAEVAKQSAAEAEQLNSDSDAEEICEDDSNDNVHCWVLIKKGQRGMPQDIYIEPTTARVYQQTESPYAKVDLIWNNKNLWVNMQQDASIDLDLFNSRFFEYVMLSGVELGDDNSKMDDHKNDDNEKNDDDGDADATKDDKNNSDKLEYLDLPPPWCSALSLPQHLYSSRYYQNEKTRFYAKSKVEKYSRYFQVDGLVRRLTKYKDIGRCKTDICEELFFNRRDKLVRRLRFPEKNVVEESFQRGRTSALKNLTEVIGKQRILEYFPSSRLDGLQRTVEDIGSKISEYFVNREDKLMYHSCKLDATTS